MDTILKKRFLCFLLSTCLHLMKTAVNLLFFIINQAQALHINTPCVKLDQPLWIMALEIAVSMKLNILVYFEGFHTMMNFVGSICYLMEGSGLVRLFEAMYAKNAVPNSISG